MAVRFLPGPEERGPAPAEDRKDLAEVIELRGALKQRAWGDARPSAWERRPIGEAWAEIDRTEPESAEPESAEPESAEPESAELGSSEPQSAVPESTEPEPPGSLQPGSGHDEHPPVFSTMRGAIDPRIIDIAASLPGAAPAAAGAFASDADASAVDPDLEQDDGPQRTSYEDGVRLLGRRARSSGELREELLRLGHDAAEVDAVIDEFERGLYLDDVGLARSVTEKLRGTKRSSRSQIRMKLIGRKLPDAAIETALGELDADEEFELLREAAADRARRLSGLDRQTAERRLLGFLARRGWSGEPAMRAARAALDGAARPAGGVRFR